MTANGITTALTGGQGVDDQVQLAAIVTATSLLGGAAAGLLGQSALAAMTAQNETLNNTCAPGHNCGTLTSAIKDPGRAAWNTAVGTVEAIPNFVLRTLIRQVLCKTVRTALLLSTTYFPLGIRLARCLGQHQCRSTSSVRYMGPRLVAEQLSRILNPRCLQAETGHEPLCMERTGYWACVECSGAEWKGELHRRPDRWWWWR